MVIPEHCSISLFRDWVWAQDWPRCAAVPFSINMHKLGPALARAMTDSKVLSICGILISK